MAQNETDSSIFATQRLRPTYTDHMSTALKQMLTKKLTSFNKLLYYWNVQNVCLVLLHMRPLVCKNF